MIPIAKVQAAVSRDKISEPFLAYVGSWHIASVRCDASTAIAIGGIADMSRSLAARGTTRMVESECGAVAVA